MTFHLRDATPEDIPALAARFRKAGIDPMLLMGVLTWDCWSPGWWSGSR